MSPATPSRASARSISARHRTDFVASRTGCPAARASRSSRFASKASRSTTPNGGSRWAVARSSRSEDGERDTPGRYGAVVAPGGTHGTHRRRGTWTNWSGTVKSVPARVHHPRTVDGVVAAVREAAAAGARLRPRGSGHSFTPLAATDGHALDLRDFAGLEAVDTTTGQVRVRAGTTLRALHRALDAHGL